MTPTRSQLKCHQSLRNTTHTKRVPKNERKLRNLLSLLAQLQKCALASILAQKLRNPDQHTSVLLRDTVRNHAVLSLSPEVRWKYGSIVCSLKAIEVSSRCMGGGDLRMALLVTAVLVQPSLLAMGKVLVREYVLAVLASSL